MKRWISKSKVKRKALLLKAWPEMPQVHRPDIETWQSLRNGHSLEDEDTIALMWPTLNAEDLSNRDTLLLLLHQRARFPPHIFAIHDIGMLNFGLRSGIIGDIELPGYFAILRGRESPETYGKLYTWDDDEDGVKSEPTRGWFSAGDSYWAVLVQSQIYWLLNVVCQQILHEMSLEEVYPAQKGNVLSCNFPHYLSKTNIEGVDILALGAYEDQYKAPRNPVFSRIVLLLSAKKVHADDHLRALREDPNYLLFTAMDRMEHMTEMVPDADGKPGPPSGLSRNKLWARVFKRLITEAIANADIFNVVFRKLMHLQCSVVSGTIEKPFSPDRPIRADINEKLFESFYSLIASSWELLATADFEASAFSSPLLRGSFYRSEKVSALGHPIIWPRKNIILDCVRDRLMWICNVLTKEHNRFDMGVRGLIAELDWFIRHEPKARALISPFLASQIATLGVFCECLHELEFFQPWISGYRFYHKNHSRELKNDWLGQHTQETNIGFARQELWEDAAKLLKTNSKGEYFLLIQKPGALTKHKIEERRSVEEHHDRFWSTLIRGLKDVKAISESVDDVLKPDVMQRTEPWIEPVKESKGKKGPKIYDDPDDQILDEAIAENKKMIEEEKAKVAEDDNCRVVELSKRALKVFRAIFAEGLSYELTNGVQWNDFVRALMSIEFKAEKIFGSGWVFTPPLAKFRSGNLVYFDEPYMGGAINFLLTKQYGRRLYEAYGLRLDGTKLIIPKPSKIQERFATEEVKFGGLGDEFRKFTLASDEVDETAA